MDDFAGQAAAHRPNREAGRSEVRYGSVLRTHWAAPAATRTAAGYRAYDEAAARQLRFVKKAQALGFSLDEIRRILSLRGGGKKTCERVLAIAEATLEETERRLTDC